jgi:hypothetical protein
MKGEGVEVEGVAGPVALGRQVADVLGRDPAEGPLGLDPV